MVHTLGIIIIVSVLFKRLHLTFIPQAEAAFPTPWLDFLPAVFDLEDTEIVAYREFVESHGLAAAAFLFAECEGSFGHDPKLHSRTPYDLGWGWLVNMNPDHSFIGRKALEKIASSPPNKFVSLEWDSDDVADVYASLFRKDTFEYMELPRTGNGPMVASSVYSTTNAGLGHGLGAQDNKPIGVAVSRCYSYWFKKMISLCIINREHSSPGTRVIVRWGNQGALQKDIKAVSIYRGTKHYLLKVLVLNKILGCQTSTIQRGPAQKAIEVDLFFKPVTQCQSLSTKQL